MRGSPSSSPSVRTAIRWSFGERQEHADLVTESDVFDDEFSSGTQEWIGNDLERFNPVPKRGKVGPETADSTAEQCGDGSHGQLGHDPGSRSRATEIHLSSRNTLG